VEARQQLRALRELIVVYDETHMFTAADVCKIHRTWLGSIYSWAGDYRQVNVTKDDFPFAAAMEIPKLMTELEKGPLREFTPCRFDSDDRVVRALATVHGEIMLIHPFREGNGRAGRLLAVLMGLQARLPPLDFTGIKGKKRQQYFAAVRARIMNRWNGSLATWSVGAVGLLHERDLARICRELVWLRKGHCHAFNGGRRTDRGVEQFFALPRVDQIGIGFD